MASILDQIFAAKRGEVATRRATVALAELKTHLDAAPPARGFVAALRAHNPAIIAEVKRASPSKGDIFPGLDPAAVARDYQAAGAAAISVLTDRHFKGSLDDLRAVRMAVELPLLRKDFIFDPYQVYEARVAGADCILLIAAMLEQGELRGLRDLAEELAMAALIEVHDRFEFDRAQDLEAELIGINNRDLHTFKTDLLTTESLLLSYEGSGLVVSESGIETPAHVRRLYGAGASAFLVGESLLRGQAPRAALGELVAAFERPPEEA